jgi:6-phosphogluconolactonase (cycloisomerase 2 family)
MSAGEVLEFVVACAGGGALQRWALHTGDARLELRQELDCAGPVAPLAWDAARSTLFAALRGEPYALLRIDRTGDGTLRHVARRELPADMAWIDLDGTRDGLLCASYTMARIAWVRDDGIQEMPTDGPAHACVALGGGRLLLATQTIDGSLLCLAGDSPRTPLAARRALRLRLHEQASPRHVARAGDWVFIDNEEHGVVDVCRYDPASNALRHVFSGELGHAIDGRPWYADIRCSEDGSWLWLSERRQGMAHLVRVDLPGRRLVPTASLPVPATPRAVAAHAGWLVSCGETADAFSVHARDAAGVWHERARPRCGARPMWVEFLVPAARAAAAG